MNIRQYKTAEERRKAFEKELKIALPHIGSFTLDETAASTHNCENMIGAAQVPVGIAGPLLLHSEQTRNYFIPLATTEGALVASVNRGCKAITENGGASVVAERVGATRGPVFQTSGIEQSRRLKAWLEGNFEELKKIAVKTSAHLELTSLKTSFVGKHAYIRFSFDTQDAMGMNMVTVASTALSAYISEKTGTECIAVAGNYDVDKKPSWLNSIEGRGIKVWAEATIPAQVLKETLKTTAQAVYDVWLRKCMIGSAMSGSMGFNAQFANVLAAMFLATGQDIAHVSEGSIGVTTTEIINKDLYVSVYLPDLMVGTVGGGTGLATQKEALSVLGITKSHELAEVIGAAVLAGEISLLASLAEGSLAKAHQKLARGKT